MASKDYSGLKKAELFGMAKRKKASVTASMKKDEIIKAIKKADKAKAQAKAKPASKAKGKSKPVKKAKPVSKSKAKAKPAKKVKASVTALATKAKTKSKTTVKTRAKVKAKAEGISGSAVKEKKPTAPKSPRPAAVGKKKTASAIKSIGKPARKVSRLAVIKEPAPKPGSKERDSNDWSIKMAARKFFTAGEQEQGDLAPEEEARLPDSYGENRLVALPKDPGSLFVYWEVQEEKAEEARQSLGKSWDQVKWTLRVFDATSFQRAEEAGHNFFDVSVDFGAGKRYLNVDGDGREYIVELGLKDADEQFSSICFSNRVQTPRASVSAGGEDFPDEKAQKLFTLSGGSHPGSVFAEEMTSLGVSSFGASEQAPAMRAKDDFFLWVNCELTVYGGTAPGSRLILQGQDVNLRPDGSFSAKFHLPDGAQDILVSGTASGGADSKEISFSVLRSSRVVR